MGSTSIRSAALIFDFDGTIIDTETAVYESWARTFELCGVDPIPLATWSAQVGQSADAAGLDERIVLCDALGVDALSESVERHRAELRTEMVAELDLRPGVRTWIEAAVERGLPLGVASSSPSAWVLPHLRERGLIEFFGVVSCADPGTPGKPDPTVFSVACDGLGVAAERALAIEDSAHGVTAAIAAGMRCLAIPGPITTGADFSHATESYDSLADADPHQWLESGP